MTLNIFKLFGIIIVFYILLPTILGRFLHLGTYWRGNKSSNLIALTFDDGPDPYYTAQLLDILKQYNVKASFFVVGKHVEQYPELVKQIRTEGHTLGAHGYRHRFCWFQNPISSIKEIKNGNLVIEKITGKSPLFFRPSWGIFNLSSLIYLWLTKQKTVLWSFMCWDWASHCTPESIDNIFRRKIKPGSVVVLHDRCTGPYAADDGPSKMLKALPGVLEHLAFKGLQPVTLEELLLHKEVGIIRSCVIRVWKVWEVCFDKLAGLKPVGDQKNNLFRLTVRHYRGRVMELPDGTLLTPGDKIGELHFNNDLLQRISSTARSLEPVGIMMLREARNSLPLLARELAQNPAYRGVKALIGVTMIHRGTTKLGFSVYELSPFIRSVVAWYQRWLLFLFHPGGFSHLRRQWKKLVPKKVIISKQELLNRYLLDRLSWPESGKTNPANGSINAR